MPAAVPTNPQSSFIPAPDQVPAQSGRTSLPASESEDRQSFHAENVQKEDGASTLLGDLGSTDVSQDLRVGSSGSTPPTAQKKRRRKRKSFPALGKDPGGRWKKRKLRLEEKALEERQRSDTEDYDEPEEQEMGDSITVQGAVLVRENNTPSPTSRPNLKGTFTSAVPPTSAAVLEREDGALGDKGKDVERHEAVDEQMQGAKDERAEDKDEDEEGSGEASRDAAPSGVAEPEADNPSLACPSPGSGTSPKSTHAPSATPALAPPPPSPTPPPVLMPSPPPPRKSTPPFTLSRPPRQLSHTFSRKRKQPTEIPGTPDPPNSNNTINSCSDVNTDSSADKAPISLLDLSPLERKKSLKFHAYRFPDTENPYPVSVNSFTDVQSENFVYENLVSALQNTFPEAINFPKHHRILFNSTFSVNSQTSLEKALDEISKYGRVYHDIMICDLGQKSKQLPDNAKEYIRNLEEEDPEFWKGKTYSPEEEKKIKEEAAAAAKEEEERERAARKVNESEEGGLGSIRWSTSSVRAAQSQAVDRKRLATDDISSSSKRRAKGAAPPPTPGIDALWSEDDEQASLDRRSRRRSTFKQGRNSDPRSAGHHAVAGSANGSPTSADASPSLNGDSPKDSRGHGQAMDGITLTWNASPAAAAVPRKRGRGRPRKYGLPEPLDIRPLQGLQGPKPDKVAKGKGVVANGENVQAAGLNVFRTAQPEIPDPVAPRFDHESEETESDGTLHRQRPIADQMDVDEPEADNAVGEVTPMDITENRSSEQPLEAPQDAETGQPSAASPAESQQSINALADWLLDVAEGGDPFDDTMDDTQQQDEPFTESAITLEKPPPPRAIAPKPGQKPEPVGNIEGVPPKRKRGRPRKIQPKDDPNSLGHNVVIHLPPAVLEQVAQRPPPPPPPPIKETPIPPPIVRAPSFTPINTNAAFTPINFPPPPPQYKPPPAAQTAAPKQAAPPIVVGPLPYRRPDPAKAAVPSPTTTQPPPRPTNQTPTTAEAVAAARQSKSDERDARIAAILEAKKTPGSSPQEPFMSQPNSSKNSAIGDGDETESDSGLGQQTRRNEEAQQRLKVLQEASAKPSTVPRPPPYLSKKLPGTASPSPLSLPIASSPPSGPMSSTLMGSHYAPLRGSIEKALSQVTNGRIPVPMEVAAAAAAASSSSGQVPAAPLALPRTPVRPLVNKGNFLYFEEDEGQGITLPPAQSPPASHVPAAAPPVQQTPMVRIQTSHGVLEIPRLSSTPSESNAVTPVPPSSASRPAPTAPLPTALPSATVMQTPIPPPSLTPGALTFSIYRHESEHSKLQLFGSDFADYHNASELSWPRLREYLRSSFQYNDFEERLCVNWHHMVDDEESLAEGWSKGYYRRGQNEMVIVGVDSVGLPSEEVKDIIRQKRKELRKSMGGGEF